MEERKIKAFFKRQLQVILERSAQEPDGFRSYFTAHEPKDEEILGLLAVSSMVSGEFQSGDSFPTALEALAALSPRSRAEICGAFRRELKHCLRQLTAA
jgi:hypothetical protein